MLQDEQSTQANHSPVHEVQERWTPQQFLQIQASLLELAHDVIIIRDPESHVVSWNHGAQELYGWTAEEALGKVTHDLLHTTFPEGKEAVEESLARDGMWEGELTHICANGDLVIVESRQVQKRDEQGQPLVVLEVNRDITTQKANLARIIQQADLIQQQSQGLAKQTAIRLRLAQRAGNIGTFEWDLKNNAITWTPELEALYGLPAGGFEGGYQNWAERVHPDDIEAAAANLQRAAEGGPPYNAEFRVIWPDGSIHWMLGKGEITATDKDGKALQIIGVNIDITRLKEAELALQNLNANLEERVAERTQTLQQLNKDLQRSNQELQDFAYVASHDLQEPLRKIQAFGNLLQEEYASALGEGTEYVDRMRHAASRMRVLIDDLLSFSRVTTHAQPFVRVNLNTIATEVIVDLEAQIEATQGTIELGELPTIDADATQMRQLFQNLLGNALKFHQRGTAPIVKIWAEELPSPESLPALSSAKSWCRIFVEDNGIGFDEKYLDRIFTVFQRLHGKNTYEGTGIGLAVVRKIVERHDGLITATSRVGQGSTFIVTLPAERLAREEKNDGE